MKITAPGGWSKRGPEQGYIITKDEFDKASEYWQHVILEAGGILSINEYMKMRTKGY